MHRLQNPVRHYAWGSGLHIPRALGQEPDGQPWAELWLGAHPAGPSLIEDGTRLDHVIAADRQGMLGEPVASAFGRLPFMMKLLAAGQPLSLQVHPSSEQARLGYAAEQLAGIPLDAAERSYRDAAHKPELVYALTRFEGMVGFRDVPRTVAILRELQLPWLHELADRLDGTRTPFQTLREVVTEVLAWHGAELSRRLAELATAAHAAKARLHHPPARRRPPALAAESVERESLRVCEQTPRLTARYPLDPGVVVTLLLNHVVLAAGEAMFVPAGIVHAYTSGFGLEIMASSDNVLRAGLTPKHVDIPGLLGITDFRPTPPPRWSAGKTNGIEVFSPPVSEFDLTILTHVTTAVDTGPALVLCLEGEAEILTGDHVWTLTAGDSVFAPNQPIELHAPGGRLAVGRCPLASGA